MEKLLAKLTKEFPNLSFCAATAFYWSPKTNQIFYSTKKKDPGSSWSLLHETAHCLLGHKTYQSDIELLNLEIEAWQKSVELSKKYNIEINPKHIERCLDSYRDWLYRRSICPVCLCGAAQLDNQRVYRCYNCQYQWSVSSARFCRTYRSVNDNKKFPTEISAGSF